MTLVLNGTTGVSAVDGSAATPAIQGNDPNTGVFFPAADTVAIATNGTEALRVDSSQNVGIGTSSPSSKLDVNGTVTATTFSGSGTSLTSLPAANLTGTVAVANGGTGAASQTAYAVLCGGTTSTGAYQSIAGVGSAGQVLTSNGAGALPTFQTVSGGVTSFNTRTGAVTLSSGDVTTALGFTPAAQPSSDGIVTRTSAGNYSARTITAGTGISVSNGNGVSGNPTITNSGVTSIAAGSNISISASTGGVTISASSAAPSTAQVLSATAGATFAAVGTYVFGQAFLNSLSLGSTIAGSGLSYSSYDNSSGGWFSTGTSSGTWRVMGASQAGIAFAGITLYLRIS